MGKYIATMIPPYEWNRY